ncbi:ABC transporter substrate-binding protein [Amycolatopsis sp. GM8]|uniref:ABC transporter substrate-binding protein n=1 Tax=Amycolatopsis sp. GM8 TaxID=2896530 RepID=UPI001F3AF7E7|nr:ABC transporter substrate-binding protein [Amycolatopsis sp. GM8]
MKRSKEIAGLAAGVAVALCSACAASSPAPDPASAGTSGTVIGGGQQADPAKSPVLVGFHNLEGGSISLPDLRIGFEAGIDYVNSQLGGINGHPMKGVECKTDGTPESSLNCANEFVQSNVVLSVVGIDFGSDAMLSVLKSASVIETGATPLTPGMDQAIGDAYFAGTSTKEGYAADVVNQHNLGAKSLAVVMVDNAANHATYTTIIAPAAQKLGMTSKVFYSPAQADWTTLSATVLATSPDAISLSVNTPDALAAVTALRANGFAGQIDAFANSDIIPQLKGNLTKNVNFESSIYQPTMVGVPAKAQADIDIFNAYMKKDGAAVKAVQQAQLGFFDAVQAADKLRQIQADPLTAKAVHDGIGTTKGSTMFSTNGYDCSKPAWPGTTSCFTGQIFSTPTGKGMLAPLANQPIDSSVVRPSS